MRYTRFIFSTMLYIVCFIYFYLIKKHSTTIMGTLHFLPFFATCHNGPNHTSRCKDLLHFPRSCTISRDHVPSPAIMHHLPRSCTISRDHVMVPLFKLKHGIKLPGVGMTSTSINGEPMRSRIRFFYSYNGPHGRFCMLLITCPKKLAMSSNSISKEVFQVRKKKP